MELTDDDILEIVEQLYKSNPEEYMSPEEWLKMRKKQIERGEDF